MSVFVGPELQLKLSQPLKFQWGSGGPELPPTTIHGQDATTLIDVCHAITKAENAGALSARHSKIVAQAHIILGASAIRRTGYNRLRTLAGIIL